MSLGVSDNVLLEAHSDGQNSQHPKLMAQKFGQHLWYFCWTIISVFWWQHCAELQAIVSISWMLMANKFWRRNESGMHSTMWRDWGWKFRILSLAGFERTWLQLGGSAGGDFHKRRSWCLKTCTRPSTVEAGKVRSDTEGLVSYQCPKGQLARLLRMEEKCEWRRCRNLRSERDGITDYS